MKQHLLSEAPYLVSLYHAEYNPKAINGVEAISIHAQLPTTDSSGWRDIAATLVNHMIRDEYRR